jgi:YggT family protein
MEPGMIALADVRADIASYVSAVFLVYIIIVFVYVLLNIVFSLGGRIPYSRASDAVLNFLRDVSEPYLRLFRRIIPTIGMIDFSPTVALIVLWILRTVITNLIHG